MAAANKNMAKTAENDKNITIEEIRKKGKKLGFSYVQALSLYMFEEILRWISGSTLQDTMWLKPSEFQCHGKKKGNVPNRIVFYKRDISYLELEQAMENILNRENKKELFSHGLLSHGQTEWKLVFFDQQIEIMLNCHIEQAEIPFKIIVRPVWTKELFPEEGSYKPVFLEEEEIYYKLYPMELNLAENFYEILDRLELIGSMKPYGEVYHILSTQPVDGRRIYMEMAELLYKGGMTSPEDRWKTVLGYLDYTYMEKCWNKYRRECGKGDVTWQQVMELLKEFFTPVVEAIRQDVIFMGDWMPNLGRYLD